jgi:hypothetical protein
MMPADRDIQKIVRHEAHLARQFDTRFAQLNRLQDKRKFGGG